MGCSAPPQTWLISIVGSFALGCQLPPEDIVSPVQTGQRTVIQRMTDPLAAERQACTFGSGAHPTDTLPITDEERAAIPIKNIVVLMKENRSFDHLLGALNAAGQSAVASIPSSFANIDALGTVVTPFELNTTCVSRKPGHQWDAMHTQVA
jgi:phospholipase C